VSLAYRRFEQRDNPADKNTAYYDHWAIHTDDGNGVMVAVRFKDLYVIRIVAQIRIPVCQSQ